MSKCKLGAALLATLVSMGIGASAAQAINWTAAAYPALISAEQGEGVNRLTFGFENSTWANCPIVQLAGELTGANSSLTLGGPAEPLGGCFGFGFSEGTWSVNKCVFVLKPLSGSGDKFSGTLDINCPEGNRMVFKGGNCEVSVGSQTGLATVTQENLTAGSPDVVHLLYAVGKLTYKKEKDGLLCPLSGTGEVKSGGTINGTTMVRAGEKGGETIDISIK